MKFFKSLTGLGKTILISFILVITVGVYATANTFTPKKIEEVKPVFTAFSTVDDGLDALNSIAILTPVPTPVITPTPTLPPTATPKPTSQPTLTPTVKPNGLLQTNQYMFANVNKTNILPSSFVPSDLVRISGSYASGSWYLRSEANNGLDQMTKAAQKEGISYFVVSGYRSFADQVSLFNTYVNNEKAKGLTYDQAVEKVKTYSAVPGHSEHQLGTAVDCISRDSTNFANTAGNLKVWNWFSKNSYKYGFIISYPTGKESLTGYTSEMWHLRYVGIGLAAKINALNYLSTSNQVTLQSELKKL